MSYTVLTGPVADILDISAIVDIGRAYLHLPLSKLSKNLIRGRPYPSPIAAANPPNLFHLAPTELISKPCRDFFNDPIYTSYSLYLGLAVGFSLLGWIATLPIFLGWWHLGRAVSLSPIVTAKAFVAPGLNTEDSNSDTKGILKDVGRREVRYGAMRTLISEELGDEAKERLRLVMGEPELVRRPNAGESFVG